MEITFKQATHAEADIAGTLAFELTREICERTRAQHFNINLPDTIQRCRELIAAGHYTVIIAYADNTPVAIATLTETYALYAGGKIGVIQEFCVKPEYRSSGIGAQLIDEVRKHGLQQQWSCVELCTPPLPEFERTLAFYQQNGLMPVGGRKMRQVITG